MTNDPIFAVGQTVHVELEGTVTDYGPGYVYVRPCDERLAYRIYRIPACYVKPAETPNRKECTCPTTSTR